MLETSHQRHDWQLGLDNSLCSDGFEYFKMFCRICDLSLVNISSIPWYKVWQSTTSPAIAKHLLEASFPTFWLRTTTLGFFFPWFPFYMSTFGLVDGTRDGTALPFSAFIILLFFYDQSNERSSRLLRSFIAFHGIQIRSERYLVMSRRDSVLLFWQ